MKPWGRALSFDALAAIAALSPWDVIYPYDIRAKPAKHKMWVCVSRPDLWFIRINTLPYGKSCVPLPRGRHAFLTHDSYLGLSGDLIQVAEAELELYLTKQLEVGKQGIVGAIHRTDRPVVCQAIRASEIIAPVHKRVILGQLESR